MNANKIKENKEKFLFYCRENIHREGLSDLLDYLDSTDFYTAPSSASFHLNEDGGLCLHSINVFETAKTLYENLLLPKLKNGETNFSEEISMESIAVSSLFHDVCKTKLYHKTEKWKKDKNGRWMTYPGYEIVDEFPFGHGEKSCLILSWFIRLKQEELLAIRWHMGMFEMTEQGSGTRFSYRAAMEKSPLVTLLQSADMLAANTLEKTTQWK
ncbi:MAG TPA: HD domain-containing protein [Alloprevotella sp.]|nr:HD domain-containing protein [Alloprevotella sp.]